MIDLFAREAARTVIGTSMGYFIGKWLGKKEHRARCSFLWDLEMEVSPKLLKKLIDQEVKEGCIKPEEADDRLAKILEIRQKYGLLGGADTFAVVRSSQPVQTSSPPSFSDQVPSPPPPPVEDLAEREKLEQKAKLEVGPPSAITGSDGSEEGADSKKGAGNKKGEDSGRKKKVFGIF